MIVGRYERKVFAAMVAKAVFGHRVFSRQKRVQVDAEKYQSLRILHQVAGSFQDMREAYLRTGRHEEHHITPRVKGIE